MKPYNAQQHYERIGKLELNEVFPIIKEHLSDIGKSKVNVKNFKLKVQSLRLRTFFKTGTICPCCNLSATFFAVERSIGNDTAGYHLNLYGINERNEEILFTHDHIIARGLGGEDNISNSRTMCGPCNWEKGKLESLVLQNKNPIELEILYSQLEKFKP